MSKRLCALVMSLMFFVLPAYAADNKPTADATKSLEQITSEVKTLLTKEKVHNIFDLFRGLREFGITWQPALTAPNDLVDKLYKEQLRMYAGVKLFDAVYAATFMQRQSVSDSVQTIEAIHEKLDLRAYADLSGNIFATLKKAAAEPESVNVQQLLDHLSTDYVQDIPALMSSPESAEYLINSLYGFTIELGHIIDSFYRNDPARLRIGMRQLPNRGEWEQIMVKLFKAFDQMEENIHVGGETIQKVNIIERKVAQIKADPEPALSDTVKTAWQEINAQIAAIRAAILTPSTR